MEVTFDDKKVQKMINKLMGNVKKQNQLKRIIADIAFGDVRDKFSEKDKARSSSGKPWPKRRKTTESIYKKMGLGAWLGHNILVGSGAMSESIRYKTYEDHVLVFSDKPYSAIHNYGGPFKMFGKFQKVMPQREFMWLSNMGMSRIVENVMNMLTKGV